MGPRLNGEGGEHARTRDTIRSLLGLAAVGLISALVGCSSSRGGGSGGGAVCSGNSSGPSICLEKSTFSAGEPITVHFAGGPAQPMDWIAVYPTNCCSSSCPSGSTLWEYCATNTHSPPPAGVSDGTVVIDAAGNSSNWPLSGGSWGLYYLVNDGYTPIASLTFQIDGGASGASPSCGKGGDGSGSSGVCSSDSDCSGSCSSDCYRCYYPGSCGCGYQGASGCVF